MTRAHAVVATRPRINTTAPQPARTHQPARLARAKSRWLPFASDAETSDPTTATPNVEPIWREVLAMAAATPAWARGMPETAALVIGAFTNPNPMPKITYAVNSHVNGVVALRPDQHQAGAREGHAGHQEGNPGPAPADDASRDRREAAWSWRPWATCRPRPAARRAPARPGGRGC